MHSEHPYGSVNFSIADPFPITCSVRRLVLLARMPTVRPSTSIHPSTLPSVGGVYALLYNILLKINTVVVQSISVCYYLCVYIYVCVMCFRVSHVNGVRACRSAAKTRTSAADDALLVGRTTTSHTIYALYVLFVVRYRIAATGTTFRHNSADEFG